MSACRYPAKTCIPCQAKYIASHKSHLQNAVVVSACAIWARQTIQLLISDMALIALHRRRNACTVFTTLILVIFSSWIPVSDATSLRHKHLHSRATFANGVELRVLPIGE